MVLQYSWLVISRIAAAALQAATILLLARWTLPSSFGQIVAALGVLIVAGALADLGLGPLLLRERSSNAVTTITARILRLNSLTSGALCVITAAGIACMGFYNSREYLALLPLSVWIAAEKNGDVWLNIATADGRTHINAVSLVSRRALSLAIFAGLQPICEAALAFTLGQAIASIVINGITRKALRAVVAFGDRTSYRQLFRRALPFYLNSVGAQMRNLDVAIVFAVAGPVVGGVYALPARLTSPLRMLPVTLGPVIVRYATMGTRTALRAIGVASLAVMVAMTAAMAALFAGAPYYIRLALGQDYSESVLPLRITCLGLVFAFAISLQTSFLQGCHQEHYVGRVGIAVSILVLPAVALGTSLSGASGAAGAVAISFLLHSLMLMPKTVLSVRDYRLKGARIDGARSLQTAHPTRGA